MLLSYAEANYHQGLMNYQPTPAELERKAREMLAAQRPLDWSLLQGFNPWRFADSRSLDERFADFKTRLAEARVRCGL